MPRGSCQLSLQRTGGDHEDALHCMAEHHTAGLEIHNLALPEAMDMAQNQSLWRMWLMCGATQS